MIKGIRFFTFLVLAALALGGLQGSHRAESASVDPSWDIQAGAPNTCNSSGFSLTQVYVNISGTASEQGTLTAPGYGQLGFTYDISYGPKVGFLAGFFVFVPTPYSLPANTPLTLTVTTYKGPNYTGGVSFIDSLTWDCTTGEILASQETIPAGCDVLMPISSTAVVGSFVADAPVYWKPGELTNPLVTITAGKTAWVLGQDASGQYYKIVWVCDLVWVPKASMGPNYDAVWNGKPLPTEVVQ